MGRTQIDQDKFLEVMDRAEQLRAVDIEGAIGVFAALSEQEFEFQDLAQQQYAICLTEARRYEQAEQIFQVLLKEHREQNTFRGYTLYHLARIAIVQARFDEAAKWVAEAEKIFKAQRDFFNLGRILWMKGVQAVRQGDVTTAIEKLETSLRLQQTYSNPRSLDSQRMPQPALASL